ncbi:hypothetical protein GE21DRAFT_1668 [Neurospora crassa]|uniref:Uncharacterized protein n=1 Tax=Neurospora crassa (strain ATCC 24698 / 74-OR23-1A / CBS 708.71 / DSM 1257 / FGSC 987) TaxID=367110 RepID=Q7S172_NEUCR|nr:hypothetical protein NCU07344 [Neurospora crassa OR74A]EAA29088.1 hypothetical protein NCU07344 [Neurospora crassa OR74A]KHE82140.1 hypothetical protein GE21DRAFT_1668 [Neurospora crassa]|eukprot:XP_958324.1 hypothetical protein NCU07344 [Neurospora crassa OR74A]
MPHSTLEEPEFAFCRRCKKIRPVGHTEHGRRGVSGEGGLESVTATAPRGTFRPPRMIRQDATVVRTPNVRTGTVSSLELLEDIMQVYL